MQNAELKQQNNIPQTPIEIALGIDENGMTTARALYEFLELAQGQFSRWAKTNIENNEFYEDGKEWWGFDIVSNGNNCKDYRLTTDFAKHLSMESHSEKGKIARQYFITVEDKAKEMVINRSQLSPELQMFLKMGEAMAQQELEQKRMAKEIEEVKQVQNVITETFQKTSDVEDFQKWANNMLAQIAESPKFDRGCGRNKNYSLAHTESYERLKQKRNCRLDDRVQKAIGRAIEEKPDIKKNELRKYNKLYIIANDKDLRPVYELVIKEMMIAYCVNTSDVGKDLRKEEEDAKRDSEC